MIERCQGQFSAGPGMSLSAKCEALASAVAQDCTSAGYAVTDDACSADASFTTSNTGCPRSQFALGISNDPSDFDQSDQPALPDGESESVTGSCQPVAAAVGAVRVDRAAGGTELTFTWDPSPDAESYTLYEDPAAAGAFDAPAAESGEPQATIPMPAGTAFFLVAGHNWVCGDGPER